MSKEWQEASNERAIEQKLNPITGTYFDFLFFNSLGCFSFPHFWVSRLLSNLRSYLSCFFIAGIITWLLRS